MATQLSLFGPVGVAWGRADGVRYHPNAIALAIPPQKPAPDDYVVESDRYPSESVGPDADDTVRCSKCSGTGEYLWGGAFENGVWTGKRGMCYACRGKGAQDASDVKRNDVYWNEYALIRP